MAALDFPSSPTNGQTYSANGSTWTYNSATTSWVATNGGLPSTLTVPEGGTGLTSLTAGYIPFGNGTSAFGSSANLTWDDTNKYLQLTGNGAFYLNGVPPNPDVTLHIGGYMSGNLTSSTGVWMYSTVPAAVTSSAVGFGTFMNTQASSFTLATMTHFNAYQATIRAGSSVTNQIAYFVSGSVKDATNNYGFRGEIPENGLNNWNLYNVGGAPNYMSGSLGIGTTAVTTASLNVGGALSGGTTYYQVLSNGSVQSDVTNAANYFYSAVSTAAAAFTLPILQHYSANQNSFGAGAIVTTQYGLNVSGSLVGATNNYGFASAIAAAPDGGISNATVSTISSSATTTTVVTTAAHGLSTGQVVTVSATANATALVSGVTCTILTAGTTDFTLIGAADNNVGTSFTATGAGTGTGTVRINQQGSGKTITVTNTTTFTFTSTTGTYAAITATGTVTPSTRWNIYASGTAPNYFSGSVGIGSGPQGNTKFYIYGNIPCPAPYTGSYAFSNSPNFITSSTAFGTVYFSFPGTQSSFTCAAINHYWASQGTFLGTVTTQYGFRVDNTLTGAGTNYGFYSDIATAAGRWNFYAAGTAPNYFAGATTFNSTVTTNNTLSVDVANNQFLLHSGATSHPTVIHRNDASNYYVLLSAAGTTASGTWNTLRPLIIGLTDGLLTSQNGQAFTGGLSTDNLKVTALTGMLKGNGASNVSVAVAGTDYMAPFASQTANTFLAAPNGSAGVPTFRTLVGADVPSGSRVLLNTLTASNSVALQDTTNLTSAYDWYEIVLQNIQVYNTSNTLFLRVQTSGGFQTTNYYYMEWVYNAGGTAVQASTTGIYIPLAQVGVLANTLAGTSGFLRIFRPSNATTNKHIIGQVYGPSSAATHIGVQVNGYWANGVDAITGVQIAAASGNLLSGVVKIYGVKA